MLSCNKDSIEIQCSDKDWHNSSMVASKNKDLFE